MSAGWRTAGLPSDKAGKFTPAAAAGSACTAIAYRGTSGRERGGLGGQVVVLQAYSSDEAGEFNSEKGPIEDGEPRRARRAPSGRREGGAGSARAGGSANSSDEAGEFNGRGPRAARSAVAAGSAYRGRVARAAARGGQQVGGLPAYSSNEDGEACGCARARRALFVVLVILKKRSGSPPKR